MFVHPAIPYMDMKYVNMPNLTHWMKKESPTALLLIFILLSSCGPKESRLIWSEEFESGELDLSSWSYQVGDGCPELCGWGNNEPQLYTKENHRLKDGKLVIQARKEDTTYTSTRITTRGKFAFQYGRMEVRASLPKGKGVWPAIWLLGSNIDAVGWPQCGEISFVEYLGKEPGQVFTMLHSQNSYGMQTANKRITGVPDIEEGFHIFEMDWTPDQMEFFVDGESVYTFIPRDKSEAVWPFAQPFFITVNMAIGGNLGGPEIDDAIFPQELVVDYIRVYEN